jgi:hypothetical protein
LTKRREKVRRASLISSGSRKKGKGKKQGERSDEKAVISPTPSHHNVGTVERTRIKVGRRREKREEERRREKKKRRDKKR